jgi:hypothetical protein
MNSVRDLIPMTGLFATMTFAAYMVVQLSAQTPAAADFTKAAVAEVRDSQGIVVLHGQFLKEEEEDDTIERKADLKAANASQNGATGEAEVEFAKTAAATQEIEFSARGLQAGSTYSFVIDGQEVASAAADSRGRAEVELDVKMPGSAARK